MLNLIVCSLNVELHFGTAGPFDPHERPQLDVEYLTSGPKIWEAGDEPALVTKA